MGACSAYLATKQTSVLAWMSRWVTGARVLDYTVLTIWAKLQYNMATYHSCRSLRIKDALCTLRHDDPGAIRRTVLKLRSGLSTMTSLTNNTQVCGIMYCIGNVVTSGLSPT